MRFSDPALAALATVLLTVLPGSNIRAQALPPAQSVLLQSHGIGPLLLGAELKSAAIRARPLDPVALPVGPGCDGRDEFAIRITLSGEPVSVMAMADANSKIEEIIIEADTLQRPRTADSEACLKLARDFAAKFSAALGPYQSIHSEQKPATVEHHLNFADGPSVRARWFRGGGHCDFALHIVQGGN